MAVFRTIKLLNAELGLERVLKTQVAAGFDLFTAESAESEEVPMIRLPSSSTVRSASELYANAFSCIARPREESASDWFFADGPTLGEWAETFCAQWSSDVPNPSVPPTNAAARQTPGPLDWQPFLTVLSSVWQLLTRLAASGGELASFHPHEILFQPPENAWRILPTTHLRFRSAALPTDGLRAFWNWLRDLPVSLPETIQTLLRFAFVETPSDLERHALGNSSLWNALAPKKPFHGLRVNRKGNQVTLSWKPAPHPESGTLRLFEVKPAVRRLPSAQLWPENALSLFFEREIPIQEAAEKLSLTLKGTDVLRLCGVRTLHGWGRLDRIFRTGGLEDVTFFECYRDEESLVLDLEWPEAVQRVKILASPAGFVSDPMAESKPHANVSCWWHDRFNPLVPKRIPLKELKGWQKIFIRLFSFQEVNGRETFSLGQTSQSKAEIEVPH